jgi:hypothetical protein
MGEKAVVKKTKNFFKSLTKRQKITLAGVGVGVLSLFIIVLIVCLWPKKEKAKQSVSTVKDSWENSSDASRRNESGQAGKSLGAKTLVTNPPPGPDSQDKSEEPGESNETLTKTEKASKKDF